MPLSIAKVFSSFFIPCIVVLFIGYIFFGLHVRKINYSSFFTLQACTTSVDAFGVVVVAASSVIGETVSNGNQTVVEVDACALCRVLRQLN